MKEKEINNLENNQAWIIPGTEDMMPYIYGKTLIGKWVFTVIGFPVLVVLIALVASRI